LPSKLTDDADTLKRLLHAKGRHYLDVLARGSNLTVFSGSKDAPEPRMRFTRLADGQYGVSLPAHNGRWDPAPFCGPLAQALEDAEATFGFHLDP
jgi:hypothetical protein